MPGGWARGADQSARTTGSTPPVLVAVAHGSRDPRSAAAVAALADEVRRQHPELDVRASFLDHSAPRLPDVLAAVAAEGHRRAIVVPLLLGHAFHARVDVPSEVAEAARRHPRLDIATAEVLGGVGTRAADGPASGSPGENGLETAALDRLAAVAGPLRDPGLGVALAAIGSSDAAANGLVEGVADGWAARFGWAAALAAFATTVGPSVAEAVATLRARGARRIAVAQWILAPGLLPDRIVEAARGAGPDVRICSPLAAHPAVAALIAERYAHAAGTWTRRAAS